MKLLHPLSIALCTCVLIAGCKVVPLPVNEGMNSSLETPVDQAGNPIVITPMWMDTTGWKTYESKKFGFTLDLPSSYVATETADGVDISDKTERRYNSLHFKKTKNTIRAEVGEHFNIGTRVQWFTLNDTEVMAIKYGYFTGDAYSKNLAFLLMRNAITDLAMPEGSVGMLVVAVEGSAPYHGDDVMNFDTALSEPEYALMTSFHFTDAFPR